METCIIFEKRNTDRKCAECSIWYFDITSYDSQPFSEVSSTVYRFDRTGDHVSRVKMSQVSQYFASFQCSEKVTVFLINHSLPNVKYAFGNTFVPDLKILYGIF
jgi:hypothetical protein